MNNLFRIQLEDYSSPRCTHAMSDYYGTLEDMNSLKNYLKSMEGTKIRYGETINALEYFDLDEEITHRVAGKEVRLLTPSTLYGQFDTVLTDHYFEYRGGLDPYSPSYPCYVSRAEVSQVLVGMGAGYARCIKAKLFGLKIRLHGTGWSVVPIKGFPGIVTWDGESYCTNLFIVGGCYLHDDFNGAAAATANPETIDLSCVVENILGEC